MKAPRNRSGFTLIELVVSLAITAVIAAFLFSFSSSLTQIWRSSQSGVDTDLDVNIALDRIAMDLESAIFLEHRVPDPIPMFALSAIAATGAQAGEVDRGFSGRWVLPSVQNSGRPDNLHFSTGDHRYGWAGLWMRFFSAQPSFNAVAYQIIRRPAFTDSTIPRYLLHRAVVRHDHTIAAGEDITSVSYSGATTSDVDAANVTSPRVSLVLLENVVDFGVRLYVYDPDAIATVDTPKGLRVIFPSRNDGDLDDDERSFEGSSRYGDYSSRYPDVVEIYLRVLSQEGANALYQAEEIESGASYESIVEKHGRVYRRMIRMPVSNS